MSERTAFADGPSTSRVDSGAGVNPVVPWAALLVGLPINLTPEQQSAVEETLRALGFRFIATYPGASLNLESVPFRPTGAALAADSMRFITVLNYPSVGADSERRIQRLESRLGRHVSEWDCTPIVLLRDPGGGELALLEGRLPADELLRLRREIEPVVADFVAPYPVIRQLGSGGSAGSRSKLEVVRFGDREAVCKTFKIGFEEILGIELDILINCAASPYVPELLEYGRNYYIIPYYSGRTLRQEIRWHGMMPVAAARLAMEALRSVYDLNYAHLDLHLQNILIDEAGGAKMIDFEAAYRYTSRPSSFEESYDVLGIPPGADVSRTHTPVTYASRWQPFIGLDLQTLLYGTPWLQWRKRLIYGMVLQPRRVLRFLRRRLGRATQ